MQFSNVLNILFLCYAADEMYVLSARNKRVTVQLVGKTKIQEKLSRFEELLSASLPYLGVRSTGHPHQINAIVPSRSFPFFFPLLIVIFDGPRYVIQSQFMILKHFGMVLTPQMFISKCLFFQCSIITHASLQ